MHTLAYQLALKIHSFQDAICLDEVEEFAHEYDGDYAYGNKQGVESFVFTDNSQLNIDMSNCTMTVE